MPYSMTGFGRSEIAKGNHRYLVEIKSVNAKYSEVRLHAPRELQAHEHEITMQIRQCCKRGRLDCFIQIQPLQLQKTASLDLDLAQQYYAELKNLASVLQISEPIGLQHILNHKAIFRDVPVDAENLWQDLQPVLAQALQHWQQSRLTEGAKLAADISSKQQILCDLVKQVNAQRHRIVVELKKRFQERVQKLMGDQTFDSGRLEQEMALWVDRSDISEESVRLQAHLQRLEELLNSKQPLGRELDFLVQEIHREINTLGQKSPDTQLSNLVIQLKSTNEKIREQVQNLE